MWTILLLVAFAALGLRSRIASRTDGRLALGATILVVGYVALSRHLL